MVAVQLQTDRGVWIEAQLGRNRYHDPYRRQRNMDELGVTDSFDDFDFASEICGAQLDN